jgi:hypothetical protein
VETDSEYSTPITGVSSNSNSGVVKEEFECNEIFTPEQTMARIFDSTVSCEL